MDAEQALRWCSAADDWNLFSEQVFKAKEIVDVTFLASAAVKDIDNVRNCIDWRFAGKDWYK